MDQALYGRAGGWARDAESVGQETRECLLSFHYQAHDGLAGGRGVTLSVGRACACAEQGGSLRP